GPEGGGLRDALDRQDTLEHDLVPALDHVGGLELDDRELLCGEEVGGAQVRVSVLVAGVDAGCVDLGRNVRWLAVVVDFSLNGEILEATAYGGDAHMADCELNAAVRR